MLNNKILIDCVYCHQGGGKTIIDRLIDEILKNKDDIFFLLLDYRYSNSKLNENYIKIRNSEFARKAFYKKNQNFKKYLCFGNVPPPIKIEQPTFIFFQNDLLLNPSRSNLGLLEIIKLHLKISYIKFRNHKEYLWLVQSNYMKNELAVKLNLPDEKIEITPIFYTPTKKNKETKNNRFLYVGNNLPHKNIKTLLKAFITASKKTTEVIEFHLTVENTFDFKFDENLKVFFHGELNSKEIETLYSNCKFFIFASLKESFGIPLIEAYYFGLKVLSSNRQYVKEIIEPSLLFDPLNVDEIAAVIIFSLQNKLKNTTLKINDKTAQLLNKIVNDV